MMTQEQLKKYIVYNPETGIFISAPTRPNAGRVVFGVPLGNKNRKGYLQHMVNGTRYSLHRLAFLYMTGSYPQPPKEVDHINGDKTDNRWCNLREVSHQENMSNPHLRKKRSEISKNIPRCDRGIWRKAYNDQY